MPRPSLQNYDSLCTVWFRGVHGITGGLGITEEDRKQYCNTTVLYLEIIAIYR